MIGTVIALMLLFLVVIAIMCYVARHILGDAALQWFVYPNREFEDDNG